jgi:hypothetical protein
MTAVAVNNANVISFIVSDPLHVGFAAIRAANPGSDGPLIAAANNVNGPGAGTVAGNPITPAELEDLIDAGEWETLTTAQLASLGNLDNLGTILIGSPATQAKLNELFANLPKSLAAIQAAYTRPAGPWEVYFGVGQQASINVLDAARNSGAGGNF